MRVTFDISVLGMGHFQNRARTGIARVIENLAIELCKLESVELNFCAYQSIESHLKTVRYIHDRQCISETQFSHPSRWLSKKILHAYSFLNLDAENMFISGSIFARVNRKLQKHLALNTRFFPPLLDLLNVQHSEILHSPFFPFPKNYRGLNQAKRFLTVYDLIPIKFPQWFSSKENAQLQSALKRLTGEDSVIAISASTKVDLCNYLGINPQNVHVVPLAASEDFKHCNDVELIESSKAKYGIPESPYILSLCTLEPRKNISQLIKVFMATIKEQRIDDLNLVLVGQAGWQFDDIFETLNEYGAFRDRVILTGYVSDADLAPLYSGAMMFVCLSLYEGFGLPPLEAMQCGVPVICSNTSSLPEVVGDAGILVEPQDTEATCQAIWKLYTSQSLRSEFSNAGIIRAKNFSWKSNAIKTLAAYKSVL